MESCAKLSDKSFLLAVGRAWSREAPLRPPLVSEDLTNAPRHQKSLISFVGKQVVDDLRDADAAFLEPARDFNNAPGQWVVCVYALLLLPVGDFRNFALKLPLFSGLI